MTNRQKLLDRLTTRLFAIRAEHRLFPNGKQESFCGQTFTIICSDVPEPTSNEMNSIVEGLVQEQGLWNWYETQTDKQYYRLVNQAYRKVKNSV